MEDASSAGVEREKRRLSVIGIRRGIAYSKNALQGIVFGDWRSVAQCAGITSKQE